MRLERVKKFWNRRVEGYSWIFEDVDVASVVFFRMAFGATMAYWSWDYLASGRVTSLYVEPEFHFSYLCFEGIKPWPGNGMYYHFLALLLLAVAIGLGFFYRLASTLFALGFTAFFLMERTNYQNHYYLIMLVAWALPFLPLNQLASFDSYRKFKKTGLSPKNYTPAWVLLSLRFHIALPYVFGGIAKLTPDWLAGEPMGLFLATKGDLPFVGEVLSNPNAGLWLSWGGLVFDLAIVPCLLAKRTRVLAFITAIGFHVINSVLFSIHIFPWFMILASTVFFEPGWPRRLFGAAVVPILSKPADGPLSPFRKIMVGVTFVYIAFHVVWPLRCWMYAGDPNWHEQGHLFSWRMMLRVKEVGIGYFLENPRTGLVASVNHKQFLAPEQAERFCRDPALVVQFAHFLALHFEKEIDCKPIVHAVVLASLNGRRPQLLIDPNKDLADVANKKLSDYIVPLTEKLEYPLWTVPVEKWGDKVTLPPIEFLEEMKQRLEEKKQKTSQRLSSL